MALVIRRLLVQSAVPEPMVPSEDFAVVPSDHAAHSVRNIQELGLRPSQTASKPSVT